MELVLPDLQYQRSYLEAEAERAQVEGKAPLPADGFTEMLAALAGLRDGTRVPEGFVQTLELWLVDGDEYFGKVQLRASAGEYQGHVGIVIRPSLRRRGLARQAAELARPHLTALGVNEVIATCDPSNAASQALIEGLGGTLVERGAMLRYTVR